MIADESHAAVPVCRGQVQPMAKQCQELRCLAAAGEKSSQRLGALVTALCSSAHNRNLPPTKSSTSKIADRITNPPAPVKHAYTAKMPPKQKVARAPQENIQLGPQVREVRRDETIGEKAA